MELLLVLGGVVAIGFIASIPARRYEKRTGKKLGRSGGAAALSVAQDIFQPTASISATVQEEQREARISPANPGEPLHRDGKIIIQVDEAKNPRQ